mmetsp:Transcript_30033/g.29285  ORF Transcript_30033/g.29285 Transcript_30033/m.29285 type:complete len:92 (-) Transcript_30033:1575-1850(-)
MEILNTTFIQNKAENFSEFTLSGMGGGIYYTCGTAWQCELSIQEENFFLENEADNSGGAIMWDELEPVFDFTSNYTDNFAWLYGNDVACFA